MTAVQVPPLAILCPALVLVTEDPVYKQDEQERDIDEARPGHGQGAGGWEAPGESHHQLKDVVEVSRDAPKSARQEVGLADLAALISVLHSLKGKRSR